MNINSIFDLFSNLYKSNRLSHFYLIRLQNEEGGNNFFNGLLKKITDKNINSHPDFIRIQIDENEKSYKVDSKNFELFFKFIGQNPANLNHRFVVIEDGHLVSEVLLNKLLKTFEELSSKITVILLVPKNEKILPTIKSRSIEIYINNLNEAKNLKLDFDQIHQQLKKGSIQISDVLAYRVDNESLNFSEANKLLNSLKKVSYYRKFNHQDASLLELIMP